MTMERSWFDMFHGRAYSVREEGISVGKSIEVPDHTFLSIKTISPVRIPK
jgi:hypothetical protein